MKKNFKVLAVMLAVFLLVFSLPITTFAATDTQSISGGSTVNDVTLVVAVPTNLDFALDPLELNVTSGSQVATTDYTFVNKTDAPVKVAVDLTATVTNGAILVDDPATLSPYDTAVTSKAIYFAALGATSVTSSGLDFASTTSGAINATGTYSSTSTAISYFNSTDKTAGVAFALEKATDVNTDGTATTTSAISTNGFASFQFFSKMNTYADWQPDDITIGGNYTLTALSTTTYSNYTTDSAYETDGFNQLKVAKPVSALTVTSSAITMVEGDTLTMSAIAVPSNATDKTVTWSVADGTGSATIVTSSGILTAVSAGTVTVTATANDGSGVTGDLQITITAAPVAVTGITVTSSAVTVTNGNTLTMSAIVAPANATDNSVTWSVANGTGSATITTSGGILTATGVGTVTVTATANDGSGVTGTLQITVTPVYTSAGFIVGGTTTNSSIHADVSKASGVTIPFYFDGKTVTAMTMNANAQAATNYSVDSSANTLTLLPVMFATSQLNVKTIVITLSDSSTYTLTFTLVN